MGTPRRGCPSRATRCVSRATPGCPSRATPSPNPSPSPSPSPSPNPSPNPNPNPNPDQVFALLKTAKAAFLEAANSPKGLSVRVVLGVLFGALMLYRYQEFYQYAHMMAESSSRPQVTPNA